MESPNDPQEAPARPPPRFSLFRNRPTWANSSHPESVDAEDEDPFDRTNQTLAQLRSEDVRRKDKKAAKKKKEMIKKEPLVRKRIKFSDVQDLLGNVDDDEDVPLPTSLRNSRPNPQSTPEASTPPSGLRSGSSDCTPPQDTLSDRHNYTSRTVINLDSESDDANDFAPTQSFSKDARRSLDDARGHPGHLDRGAARSLGNAKDTVASTLSPAEPEPEPTGLDPVITILITSSIPNTSPLMVQRRMSQRLKEVRLAWCQKQGFDEATTATIFLTWRKRRLFDFTSSKGLGLAVNADGEVYIQGQSNQPPGEENAQLHMEAMTQAILEAEKKAAEQPLKEDVEDTSNPKGKGGPPGIKVILRSKGFDDYKLLVRPHTPFSQIASVFRKMRSVAPDKTVTLEFDGDVLAEDDTVGNSEISDMDMVDVRVR